MATTSPVDSDEQGGEELAGRLARAGVRARARASGVDIPFVVELDDPAGWRRAQDEDDDLGGGGATAAAESNDAVLGLTREAAASTGIDALYEVDDCERRDEAPSAVRPAVDRPSLGAHQVAAGDPIVPQPDAEGGNRRRRSTKPAVTRQFRKRSERDGAASDRAHTAKVGTPAETVGPVRTHASKKATSDLSSVRDQPTGPAADATSVGTGEGKIDDADAATGVEDNLTRARRRTAKPRSVERLTR